MPESLVTALGRLGHQVESVNHLGIKGIADEAVYRDLAQTYDLCFTRDIGFAHNVRQKRDQVTVKVLHVMLRQQRIEQFLPSFLQAFEQSDWSNYENGSDWP